MLPDIPDDLHVLGEGYSGQDIELQMDRPGTTVVMWGTAKPTLEQMTTAR